MLKTSTSIYITAVLPSDYLGKPVREDNTIYFFCALGCVFALAIGVA